MEPALNEDREAQRQRVLRQLAMQAEENERIAAREAERVAANSERRVFVDRQGGARLGTAAEPAIQARVDQVRAGIAADTEGELNRRGFTRTQSGGMAELPGERPAEPAKANGGRADVLKRLTGAEGKGGLLSRAGGTALRGLGVLQAGMGVHEGATNGLTADAVDNTLLGAAGAIHPGVGFAGNLLRAGRDWVLDNTLGAAIDAQEKAQRADYERRSGRKMPDPGATRQQSEAAPRGKAELPPTAAEVPPKSATIQRERAAATLKRLPAASGAQLSQAELAASVGRGEMDDAQLAVALDRRAAAAPTMSQYINGTPDRSPSSHAIRSGQGFVQVNRADDGIGGMTADQLNDELTAWHGQSQEQQLASLAYKERLEAALAGQAPTRPGQQPGTSFGALEVRDAMPIEGNRTAAFRARHKGAIEDAAYIKRDDARRQAVARILSGSATEDDLMQVEGMPGGAAGMMMDGARSRLATAQAGQAVRAADAQGQIFDLENKLAGLTDANDPGGRQRAALQQRIARLSGMLGGGGREKKFELREIGGGYDEQGNPIPKRLVRASADDGTATEVVINPGGTGGASQNASILAEARDAVSRGAEPEKVIARLKSMGVEVSAAELR